jgi:hypothetical protein
VEVTGRLAATSDPDIVWGIEFKKLLLKDKSSNASSPSLLAERGVGGEVNVPLRILLNGYGFFAVIPPQPDFTPFIHIRTHGESNKLTLNVGNDGKSELRINDEIAWKGVILPPRSSAVHLINADGFALENISIFSHSTIPH